MRCSKMIKNQDVLPQPHGALAYDINDDDDDDPGVNVSEFLNK